MDYVRTVYKHRWIALTAFAVLFLGVAVQTFTATPIYEGRVQLLLDPANPNVMKFKEVTQASYLSEQYFYQTQSHILKSRGLARRTIEALKLWDSPEFGGGEARRSFSMTGALQRRRRLGGWAVPRRRADRAGGRPPGKPQSSRARSTPSCGA